VYFAYLLVDGDADLCDTRTTNEGVTADDARNIMSSIASCCAARGGEVDHSMHCCDIEIDHMVLCQQQGLVTYSCATRGRGQTAKDDEDDEPRHAVVMINQQAKEPPTTSLILNVVVSNVEGAAGQGVTSSLLQSSRILLENSLLIILPSLSVEHTVKICRPFQSLPPIC
jgi:hypothetical protein